MDKEKIQAFLLSKGKWLPMSEIRAISSKLLKIEDENLIFELYSLEFKNPGTYTLLYWLLPGFAFIDRFLVGSFNSGLLKLSMPIIILLGVFSSTQGIEVNATIATITIIAFVIYCIWLFIDGFTINERVKIYNLDKIYSLKDFNTRPPIAKPNIAKQQNPILQNSKTHYLKKYYLKKKKQNGNVFIVGIDKLTFLYIAPNVSLMTMACRGRYNVEIKNSAKPKAK